MPVSRKRKKKSQSGRRPSNRPGASTPSRVAQADIFTSLVEHRRKLDERRTALATASAGEIVDALVAAAAGCSDDALEDDFCVRFGATMARYEGGRLEDMVNPENLVYALLSVLDERLRVASGTDDSDETKAGEAAENDVDLADVRRVLAVVAGVLPMPLSDSVHGLVTGHLGAREAKRVARGRAVTGPLLWARDVYGSRWAVVAPFAPADGPDRWYLWDVDACGFDVVTVYGGFYQTAESALAAWREAVGPAAVDAVLTTVDDAETLHALLPSALDDMRLGGESREQYAEYLRSRRLGRIARDAVGRSRAETLVRLTADDAQQRFTERLLALGYPDGPVGDDSDEGQVGAAELAGELADSWSPRDHPTLYPLCSPHKVAASVLHVRDYYKDDYAAEIVAVLPEWIRFLAEQTGMTAELTERCLAYASGERQFPGILDDEGRSDPMARVIE